MARRAIRRPREGAFSRTVLQVAAPLMAAGMLAGCNASTGPSQSAGFSVVPQKQAVQRTASSDKEAHVKVGNPYQIAGRWYHPQEEPGYDEVGAASWYGNDFHGRRTANGETYDMHALSAAHPTLPMPSYARVTNLDNNRSVVVRINDRGPFAHGRVIDLSKQTARLLDFKHNGTAEVRVQYVGPASPQGDDGWLTTTVRDNGEPVEPGMVADMAPAPVSEPTSSASGGEADGQDSGFTLASGFARLPERNTVAATFSLFDQGAAVGGSSGIGLKTAPSPPRVTRH